MKRVLDLDLTRYITLNTCSQLPVLPNADDITKHDSDVRKNFQSYCYIILQKLKKTAQNTSTDHIRDADSGLTTFDLEIAEKHEITKIQRIITELSVH